MRLERDVSRGREAVEGPSDLVFEVRSAGAKLRLIGDSFGFSIDRRLADDHDRLGRFRWDTQELLGSTNPFITRGLTRLYFEYARGGRSFLQDDRRTRELLADLVRDYGPAGSVAASEARELVSHVDRVGAGQASDLISRYHFLGYSRSGSLDVGGFAAPGGPLVAVASLSAWDITHATWALERKGLSNRQTMVLSRLLVLPGKRITLSQFLSQIVRWVHRNLPEIAAIVTYCNPNAGHYGTVYRGANFMPLCFEQHPFIAYRSRRYQSPRQIFQLVVERGEREAQRLLEPSAIAPLPLLLYWYRLRHGRPGDPACVGGCDHPYPGWLADRLKGTA